MVKKSPYINLPDKGVKVFSIFFGDWLSLKEASIIYAFDERKNSQNKIIENGGNIQKNDEKLLNKIKREFKKKRKHWVVDYWKKRFEKSGWLKSAKIKKPFVRYSKFGKEEEYESANKRYRVDVSAVALSLMKPNKYFEQFSKDQTMKELKELFSDEKVRLFLGHYVKSKNSIYIGFRDFFRIYEVAQNLLFPSPDPIEQNALKDMDKQMNGGKNPVEMVDVLLEKYRGSKAFSFIDDETVKRLFLWHFRLTELNEVESAVFGDKAFTDLLEMLTEIIVSLKQQIWDQSNKSSSTSQST